MPNCLIAIPRRGAILWNKSSGKRESQRCCGRTAMIIRIQRVPSCEIREPMSKLALTRTLLAVAAVMMTALMASLIYNGAIADREIAKITGLNGSLTWTGDGGRVVSDLSLGAQLTGGTVEGMSPESWVELEFNDGSIVMISGNSMLTFSDHAQKELHVREGSVSCNVNPQPAGKPMLIHTRSAMLEVLGTQFKVEAGLTSTMLNVNEGKVRVKRLSDGNTVDVLAKHRLIATADQDMSPVAVPDSVSQWKSQLQLGPATGLGKWLPATDQKAATLKAIPFVLTTHQGKTITLYVASFNVSRGDHPPVVLQPDSRFRVRGHIASAHDVFFGVTVNHANGEFAGNFQTIQPAVHLKVIKTSRSFLVYVTFGSTRRSATCVRSFQRILSTRLSNLFGVTPWLIPRDWKYRK